MAKWIVLLRGINVGGNNLFPMKDLVSSLEKIGCTDVMTYIQSGNVILISRLSQERQLSDQIAKTILKDYGFEPKVLVLSAKELARAVTSNPFPDAVSNPKSLHLFFFAKSPTPSNVEKLAGLRSETEDYSLVGKRLYLHAPDGIGRSKLAAGIEKTLKVDTTARNWRTIMKLLELSRP